MMGNRMKTPCPKILVLIWLLSCCIHVQSKNQQDLTSMTVGIVGDINSGFGRMMSLCMDMAISDFYLAHPHYKTRLHLRKREAKNMLDLNLQILESAQRGEVTGILGSLEEPFVAAVGERAQVPIISFTARSSPTSHPQHGYFVRAALDDAVQAEALAALCQTFKWTQVVILYEDTEHGRRFLSHSITTFQDVNIGLSSMVSISTSAKNDDILKELHTLKGERTKVFVVHMNTALGYQLFALAHTSGMMSEGYAWIITDRMSIFMNDNRPNTQSSMDGVLGIRPRILSSKKLEYFQQKWKRNMMVNKITTKIMELNVYGLWAYDAVTAIALAVEEIGELITTKNSSFGPTLLSKLTSIKFRGLAGNFQLVEGKLVPSTYEIFNVVGNGEKTLGFWSPEERKIQGTKELRPITWPGDSHVRPAGWKIPANGILRVGIPWKRGFKEFVDVRIDPVTNITNATGFAIDIFLEALKALPFPINFKFHCYNGSNSTGLNWTYDDMLQMIPQDQYDMVVGDVTIWAQRTEYVDFSLPYSDSGVVLVVKNRKPVDMWIFIKPLRWDLWLAIIVACVCMGVALRMLEHSVANNEEQVTSHVARPKSIYWSPIAILAFPERNMVRNNWSVFTLVCWLFMAFILMQSYTANLSAILTVDQLKFAFSEDYFVGYHRGSYMKTFLIEKLCMKESQLKSYPSTKEFHEAMLKGSKKGGIDAIFDDLSCMKIFLNKYGSQYKIVGPTFRTDGLGFAFPRDSPLVPYFSRAILSVTQGPLMSNLERKNFGPGYSSQDPLSHVISQGTSSLTLWEFAGLFLTVGLLTLFALFFSETPIGRKICNMVGYLIQNGLRCRNPRVHSTTEAIVNDIEISQEGNHVDNASRCDGDEIEENEKNAKVIVALDNAKRVEHR